MSYLCYFPNGTQSVYACLRLGKPSGIYDTRTPFPPSPLPPFPYSRIMSTRIYSHRWLHQEVETVTVQYR